MRRELLRWRRAFIEDLTGVSKMAKDEPLPGFLLTRLSDSTWWQAWSVRLAELLTSSLLESLKAGTRTAGRQLEMKLSWDYIQPAALNWARENAGKLVSGILPDVQAGISQIVTAGMGEGKTMYQIRDEIAALKDAEDQAIFPEWRATRIARTEVIRAHAQGAKLGYEASGVVRGMRWLDGQSNACPKCRALHNKVIRLGEKFYVDPKFGDGLPPRHPHCRCAVAPVTLDQTKHLPIDHPLRDDRRNSIEGVTDVNAYAEIGGVRATGERLRHAQYKHPELSAWKSRIETVLLMPDAVRERGTLRDYFLDTGQVSPSSGKPLRLKVVVQMEPSPFVLTAYLTTQK